MAWIEPGLDLRPRLETRLLPLPKILAGLELLTLPAERLEEDLRRRLADNPFCRILPPTRAAPLEASWEEHVEAPTTMDDHLRPQLWLCPSLATLDRTVTEGLLERLDSRGYLNVGLGELAAFLGQDEKEAGETLTALQDWIDPPGFFALDLVDCLSIQLRRRHREGSVAWRLLSEGRALLEKGTTGQVASALALSHSALSSALEELRRLDPHPGRAFAPCRPLVAEIAFKKGGRGLIVSLIEGNLPRLIADEAMLPWRAEKSLSQAWRGFQETAKLLARRYRTKLRLALFLASRQEGYLSGPAFPAPLVLDEAASDLELHSSTIHRAARSTWALSPRGTICLDHLFSRPLQARPDLSVAALRSHLARGLEEGKSYAAVARELGIPRRTAAWHGKRLMKKR